jgi:hypothetical protein
MVRTDDWEAGMQVSLASLLSGARIMVKAASSAPETPEEPWV